MQETRLNLGLIVKGEFKELEEVKQLVQQLPGVKIAFSTYSGDKLFILPHRRGYKKGVGYE